MDNTWNSPTWNWGRNTEEDRKKGKVALFRCQRDPTKLEAYAVQVSQDRGSLTPNFKPTEILKTQADWDNWLNNVLNHPLSNGQDTDENQVPPPDSTTAEGSLSLVVCPRAPDTTFGKTTLRNPLNLATVPIPDAETFIRLIETFHIHQATQTIVNRGWPIIIRSEDHTGTVPKIHYNLRTANTLEHDTALTITHIPTKRLTYALALGYTVDDQVKTILGRLAYSEHATLQPFTLINAFIQIEKKYRFDQVERYADEITKMMKNFQHEVARSSESKSKFSRPVSEDDPRDLVGLAAEMRLLRNGLVSWAKELERFRAKVAGEFPRCLNGDEKYPLLDAGEYLDRTVDEYAAMVRRCEGMLEQVSMTFQMETSSIARQEVNKMKALAILTMVFLPATFVATFMSMGLFEWHPEPGEGVVSKYWYVYFAVAGGLTLIVFLLYMFWSRVTGAWSGRGEKSEREMA